MIAYARTHFRNVLNRSGRVETFWPEVRDFWIEMDALDFPYRCSC
jgi:hypothetical protein